MQEFNYLEIAENLDLKGDEVLWIASDLSRLALHALTTENKFHPDQFLQSFENVLIKGTLLIPGFVNTYHQGQEFDLQNLKPQTGGLSMAAFKNFKMGRYIRTHDPLHSFFVRGVHADRFTSITNRDTFGPQSSFALLEKMNGYFLGIDIEPDYCFTYAHYVEQKQKVNYRRLKNYSFIVNGNVEHWNVFEKKNGYKLQMKQILNLFPDSVIRYFNFQGIPLYLINLSLCSEFIERDIQNNHAGNLITFDSKWWIKQTLKSILNLKR